jgi:hypothetical protein
MTPMVLHKYSTLRKKCLTHLKIFRASIRASFNLELERKHRWFSGRMLACHAGGPGSIPGRCKTFDLI